MSFFSIAIDGPAGAGKSTIAKKLALKLNYTYVDTGAMYRAIGYFVLQKSALNIEELIASNGSEVLDCFLEQNVSQIAIDLDYIDGVQQIYLNGTNITDKIRTQEMGNLASIVSANKTVRLFLVKQQQEIAKKKSVVMDGRDIGTFVLKEANLKIYLTASSFVRAKRRWEEFREKGIAADLTLLEKEICERDERDMTREFAPLKKAEDAVVVDSSDMGIDEVVESIYQLIPGSNSEK